MHPILVNFGYFKIHSYGFLIVAGFLLAIYFIRKKAVVADISPNSITDAIFWSFLIGLLGGRVLFVITAWDYYSKHLNETFMFWKGGLVYYGGFIVGSLVLILFCRLYKIPFLKSIDIAGPSLAIGHAVARLGCLAAGCCFGRPAPDGFPFSVIFTHPDSATPKYAQGIPLHPAQVYDTINNIIIFFILQEIYKRKKFDGQVILSYAMLYAIGRSIVETYRGDKVRGFLFEGALSTSQFIALVTFFLSAGLYWYLGKRTKEGRPVEL